MYSNHPPPPPQVLDALNTVLNRLTPSHRFCNSLAALPSVSTAFAEVGGSFSAENLATALSIADFTESLTAADSTTFRLFITQCSKAAVANQEAASELGDVPDEFRDPILDTIMHDPVTLPSGHVLDRATIMSHLLSNDTDPFTRMPLSLADLRPDRQLQNRVTAWIALRRSPSQPRDLDE